MLSVGLFVFARFDDGIFGAFIMIAREYKIGLSVLAIVFGYLYSFKMLPYFQLNTLVVPSNSNGFIEPSQQQLLFNSLSFLTFFDQEKFLQLKTYDEDSSPCISTKLQVLICVSYIARDRRK